MNTQVFKVIDVFEGKDEHFFNRKEAVKYKLQRREEIHQKYCIEKWGPKDCLCSETNKQQECAAHHYLRTTPDHDLEECPHHSDVAIHTLSIH